MKEKNKLYLEIKQLVTGMFIVNLIVFIVSLFWGLNLSFLLGLIIGLLFSCWNMGYLGYTISKSIVKSQNKAKRYMAFNYMFRYSVFVIIFVISIYTKYINTVAVLLPLFYPRFVLGFNLFFNRKEDV